jgi:arylformamidase
MNSDDPLDARSWTDVSVALRPDIATFPGDPTYTIERALAIATGAICNVSRLDMGVHTGTHLDAPSHFIEGAPGSESIRLDDCIGPAWVVDATALRTTIGATELAGLDIPANETRILFKTANSELWSRPGFSDEFIGLDGDAAQVLVARGVRLVGTDYLSIAPFGNPAPTHRTLLGAAIVILEGLDLRGVDPGPIDLLCLPLRLVGSDGVSARALVRRRAHSGPD